MTPRALVSFPLVYVGLSLAVALTAGMAAANRTSDARAAMSCFVIAGKIACIDVGTVPVAPIAPVMGPIGPDIDGEHEDIVIRDDGGRNVATG